MLKNLVQKAMRCVGYEIRRLRPGGGDVFSIQRHLSGDRDEVVILDGGANIGQTARRYRETFPMAQIFSFEPFPASYDALVKTVRNDPLSHPFQVALGCEEGSQDLHVGPLGTNNSLLPRTRSGRRYYRHEAVLEDVVPVPVTAIDCFCRKKQLAYIDILKLDIQGCELMALRGAEGTLGARRIGLIYTEVMFVPMYENGAMFWELCDHLALKGYALHNLYNLRVAGNGQLTEGDAIFVSPEVRRNVIDAHPEER